MKNFKLIILAMLVSFSAQAKKLSAQDIRDRFELRADIYVTDASGEKIIAGPESTNYWKFTAHKGEIKGDWSSNFSGGLLALRHAWTVNDDGTIQVSIEEFSGTMPKEGRPEYKESLGKKEFKLKNFEPVVWEVKNLKNQHYIVRYIPTLADISAPINIDSLPVAGKNISISDNNGYLWAEEVDFNGKYTGITSHRGTIILSYIKFAGSKEMGIAEANQITLNVDQNFKINLRAAEPFLPAGVQAKVYAYYNPNKKSPRFTSLRTFDSSDDKRLKEVMQN